MLFQYPIKFPILTHNNRQLLRRLHYHPNLVVIVVWKPDISILISIDKSNYCSWSWQVIFLDRISTLIQFSYLESISHAEPHIIENVNPNAIRARVWSSQIGRDTSELQSPCNLVCRLLLEKKNHHLR